MERGSEISLTCADAAMFFFWPPNRAFSRCMRPCTPEEIDEALVELPEWLSTDFAIHRSYSFPSFRAAIAFVNAVADVAERHDHHPDIEIHFRDVSLSLWTHTVSGVTKRDISLAKDINGLSA